jgi:hypothetical protein
MHTNMNTPTTPAPTKGLALLIKAPSIARTFIPTEGETIKLLDKNGKEVWSIKVPAPNNNPGVTIYDVQIDLLIERDFGHFAQKTWNRSPAEPPAALPPPTANPS